MSITISKYTRKPFAVEAIRVTDANLEEVAKWCGGEVLVKNDRRYIKVDVTRPLTVKQTHAYPGDWVLKSGGGYKVYTHQAFNGCFDEAQDQKPPQQEKLFDSVPAGYPQPSTR